MIITVSTTDGLSSAIKAAHAGDTILMAPGNYTTVNLTGINPSGNVTITSLDASHPAVVSGISVMNSSNLTFTNIEVTPKYQGGYGVTLGSDTNVHLNNLNIHASATMDGTGILIQNSKQITVDGSNIHNIATGIAYLNSDTVLIANNQVNHVQSDAMHGGGTSNITITGNTISDFAPKAGDHPDAIQFWTTGTTVASHDITITNNSMLRGAGSTFQGIFMGADASLAFQNVTIAGNAIEGSMYNGIAVGNATNVKVENNLVQGYTDMSAGIWINGTKNLLIDGNSAAYITLSKTNIGVDSHDNTLIPLAPVGDTSILTAWLKTVAGTTTTTTTAASAQHTDILATSAGASPAPTSILGTTGSDKLAGTSGADLIDGKGGADTMSGGGGNDTYVVDNAKDVVTESVNGGTDTVNTSLSTYKLPSQVENLVLTGKTIQTGIGNELNNVLTANSVSSSLNGGAGNDVLVSVGGADTLTGGLGNDTFRFEHVGAKPAVITDFVHGQDTIDLQNLLTHYSGTNAIADHWVKLQTDTTGTTVYVDSDGPSGAGGFVAVAKVLGVTSLSAGHDWLF